MGRSCAVKDCRSSSNAYKKENRKTVFNFPDFFERNRGICAVHYDDNQIKGATPNQKVKPGESLHLLLPENPLTDDQMINIRHRIAFENSQASGKKDHQHHQRVLFNILELISRIKLIKIRYSIRVL